ncbi:unannotated protein [freshwater metagenome]|uniref:Unannotated protein n=1 Tax=freshwater metagenome TaxID=449393 RepID=A0A6J7ICR5_9ZZZZ|nr:3-keto-5-aminohexanoate cleavage protein [Actinomycetota bacterium]
MGDLCIIELRANESARRTADRPHVPLTPDEIVADACEAAAAGASILHFHARDPQSGRTVSDPAVIGDVAARVRQQTGMVIHPTLGGPGDQDPARRTLHIAQLRRDPARRADLVPVDFGSMNFDLWDADARRFRSDHRVYLNPRGALTEVLGRLRDLAVPVVAVCWSVGQVRTARRFQEMGLLERPFWQLFFTGPEMPDGMAPTRTGLEAMVEQVPAGEPWSVALWGADALELATWAIELGGHVSTGLGDWRYARLGTPRNADIVAELAQVARGLGRTVASAYDARELLRLPDVGTAAPHDPSISQGAHQP